MNSRGSRGSRGTGSSFRGSSRRSQSPHPRFPSSVSSGSRNSGMSTDSQRGIDRVKDFRKKIFQRIKSKVQRSDDDDEEFGCIEDFQGNIIDRRKTELLKRKLGLSRRVEIGRISNDDLSLSARGETPRSEGSPGRDFPVRALTNETLNFNSRSNSLAGWGETPHSEVCSGRDIPGRALTNEAMGFYPYAERFSDSEIGHPLIDEMGCSGKGEIPLTEVVSGRDVPVGALTNEIAGFNPYIESELSRRGETPLSEGSPGTTGEVVTNETSGFYPCVERCLREGEKRFSFSYLKTLHLKRILGIKEEMNMIQDESFWDEFEIEIDYVDEINLSERKFISDYPEFEESFDGMFQIRVIFDSGCTSHICSELYMFDTIRDERGFVKLPDKTIVEYEGKGTIGFLEEVLWIPGVNGMYISCGKLDDDGMHIHIGGGKLEVSDEYGNVICTGTKNKGLYHLDYDEEIRSISEKRGSAPKKLRISSGKMKNIDLLHHCENIWSFGNL